MDQGGASAQNPCPYLLWEPGQSSLDASQAAAALAQTQVAQPAIFAMEMALVRLLESWGIRAAAVIGHSVGEFAAACVAGVFELEDAMRLVAARGRLMQAQPAGKMLAVRAPADRLEALLPAGVGIAAVNAPGLTVVSGSTDLIDALAAALAQQGIQASALVTSHAYHSPMMAPARSPLVETVASVPRQAATTTIISTVLARAAAEQELCDPDYWGHQLMSPVRFADSVVVAAPDEHHILLEVGPGQTLTMLARQTLAREAGRVVLSSLGPVQSPGSDVASLLSAVGRLWVAGAAPDWAGLQAGHRQRVALPTYPFERKRFWVEPMALDMGVARGDADAPVAQCIAPAPVPVTAASFPEAGFADGVERLIQQQLVLISEQIRALGEAPADKPVR